jgi:hypothetical protein
MICDNIIQSEGIISITKNTNYINDPNTHNDLICSICKKEYKFFNGLKKHQLKCNNETNSLFNDKIINEVKKDYEYKLEIEKLKLKNEQLKNEYEQKLEIERLKSELKYKNQECETLKITNTNSNNNITNNNITNINISKLDFLNTNFCNVLNIDDFIENYKNKYCLTKEETQILLENSSMGGLDNCITTLAYYLQRIAHKMYTDLKQSNLTVKEAIMPILLVDGSARSHYEKNETKWIRTPSMDKLKAIYNITNDQIFKHHNKHLLYNGYQRKKIQNGILKMCDYARLNDLTNDFYKKKQTITNQDSSSNNKEITNTDNTNTNINTNNNTNNNLASNEDEETDTDYDEDDYDTDYDEDEDEDNSFGPFGEPHNHKNHIGIVI